ncbi:predicted protein [Methanosarcina acetivorans C2A]|uniref:Uncharacterized protein n=1 Tax=Methanosarcina acetivorans (strain ATCC 35395 / DSM 2834 / JCM 12185 / C2A) TaxID=188937 RepID=Q8TMQ8_METAC|nr:predicted protein [Methanosarcina acetivorans C2A]
MTTRKEKPNIIRFVITEHKAGNPATFAFVTLQSYSARKSRTNEIIPKKIYSEESVGLPPYCLRYITMPIMTTAAKTVNPMGRRFIAPQVVDFMAAMDSFAVSSVPMILGKTWERIIMPTPMTTAPITREMEPSTSPMAFSSVMRLFSFSIFPTIFPAFSLSFTVAAISPPQSRAPTLPRRLKFFKLNLPQPTPV